MTDKEYFDRKGVVNATPCCYIPEVGFLSLEELKVAARKGEISLKNGDWQMFEVCYRTPCVDLEKFRKEAEWLLEDGRLGEDICHSVQNLEGSHS
jgi:hypothetical protein